MVYARRPVAEYEKSAPEACKSFELQLNARARLLLVAAEPSSRFRGCTCTSRKGTATRLIVRLTDQRGLVLVALVRPTWSSARRTCTICHTCDMIFVESARLQPPLVRFHACVTTFDRLRMFPYCNVACRLRLRRPLCMVLPRHQRRIREKEASG